MDFKEKKEGNTALMFAVENNNEKVRNFTTNILLFSLLRST